MKQIGKKLITAVLAASLALSSVIPSYAAKKQELRIPITSVAIAVKSNVVADTDYDEATVMVTSLSDQYTVGAYQWVNAKDYWKIGDVPKVKIELHAKTGYYFKVTGASKYQITGAQYGSAKKKNNNETIELTVKLNPASGQLEDPEGVEWVGYPIGKASWNPVESAGAYELKLFKNGNMIFSVPKVNATTYDFHPYMTEAAKYQFIVRAIPKDSEELNYVTGSDWSESGDLRVEPDEVSPFVSGGGETPGNRPMNPGDMGWKEDKNGWRYRNADGTFPASDWAFIGDQWYLFDSDGYMLTGWQMKNGKLYYLTPNGDMVTGWQEMNKQFYLFGMDGALVTGWADFNHNRYYFDESGVMVTGWRLIDGNWYYFNPQTGVMMRNIYVGQYFINDDGVMIH